MTGPPDSVEFDVRAATSADAADIEAIAQQTWTDRDEDDYLPRVFEDWLESEPARTAVAEVADPDTVPGDAPGVAGIAQCVMLSADEAWAQGMRVHPAYRGAGVGSAIVADLFDWAQEQGATVVRNMVFSWNGAGLGQSRATGFEPTTEIRYVHPEPATGVDTLPTAATVDPTAAWRFWTHSDAREYLRGLAGDDEESWSLRELTRADLEAAAEDDAAIAVRTANGVQGMTLRSRIDQRSGDAEDGGDGEDEDDGPITVAVYGAAAWDDVTAARTLFDAIAADAASVDADRTKVLVPETVRHVSDVAACRVPLADGPEFVLSKDLADGA